MPKYPKMKEEYISLFKLYNILSLVKKNRKKYSKTDKSNNEIVMQFLFRFLSNFQTLSQLYFIIEIHESEDERRVWKEMTDVVVLQCGAMARQSMLGQKRVLFMNKTIFSFLNKFSEMNRSALETREFTSLSLRFFATSHKSRLYIISRLNTLYEIINSLSF